MTSNSATGDHHMLSKEFAAAIQCSALIGGQLLLGYAAHTALDPTMKATTGAVHVLLGFVILTLAILRLVQMWKASLRPSHARSTLKRRAIKSLDILFYSLVMIMVASGIGTILSSVSSTSLMITHTSNGFWISTLAAAHFASAPLLLVVLLLHTGIAIHHSLGGQLRLRSSNSA